MDKRRITDGLRFRRRAKMRAALAPYEATRPIDRRPANRSDSARPTAKV